MLESTDDKIHAFSLNIQRVRQTNWWKQFKVTALKSNKYNYNFYYNDAFLCPNKK